MKMIKMGFLNPEFSLRYLKLINEREVQLVRKGERGKGWKRIRKKE